MLDPQIKDWIETIEHLLGIAVLLGGGHAIRKILHALHDHEERGGTVLRASGIRRLFRAREVKAE